MGKRLTAIILVIYVIACSTYFSIMEAKPAVLEYSRPEIVVEYPETNYVPEPRVIETIKHKYEELDVPENSGFKSYMSYEAITSKTSLQYILQEEEAYTGEYGIRQVDGRYCVALGSYFTLEIGALFDLVLENGTVIPCVLADQKADQHTDNQNIITAHNGCLSEFVVDTNSLHDTAKLMGDISYCNDDWNSPVSKIRVYN